MENLNLIRKVAWSFAQKTSLEWDELFSNAALAYSEALQSYDPDSGTKFSTYAYQVMRNSLINYCKQYQIRKSHEIRLDEDTEFMDEAVTHFNLQDITSNWNDACKESLKLVIDNFDELDQMPPKFARGAIVRELRIQGWKWNSIWGTMKEMKQLVKNAEFSQ